MHCSLPPLNALPNRLPHIREIPRSSPSDWPQLPPISTLFGDLLQSSLASSPPCSPSPTLSNASVSRSSSTKDRYLCSACGKAFGRPSSLKIHSHTHTGERPFICPHRGCEKAFSVRSNMKRHLKVHGL